MTQEWRRLLVAPERLAAGAALVLEPPELHYLRRVLRLRPGQRFALVDGAGHLWSATLAEATADGRARALLEQPPQRPLLSAAPAAPSLQLAVALPRRDADVLLRMACELGIDRFTPLRAGRSVAAAALRPQRQEAILREALEQCERLWLPRLDPVAGALELLGSPPAQAGGPPLRLLATTRRPQLPCLQQSLAALTPAPGSPAPLPPALVVAIGPEGGWTPEEEGAAEAAGWQAVALDVAILRTSTAAVAAAALLSAWRRGLALSCGTSRPPSP